MFNKVNTRTLFIIFIVLLGLVILVIPEGKNKKNRSFKSELYQFDEDLVKEIYIYPKAGGKLISFNKKDDLWYVSDEKGEYNADPAQVEAMIKTISELKATRLASNDKESWKKYEVTDSLGTRLEFSDGKKKLADLYVGKFSYSQPTQPAANPYMQQQGIMTSFVRLAEDKKVYAVEGFLSMTFNRKVDEFRDSKVLQLKKENITKIDFQQPESSFSLIKNDNNWLIDGLITDSLSTANYLSGLNFMNSTHFIAENAKPIGSPSHSINFNSEEGMVVIEAFYTDSLNIALSSSLNPGSFFDGTKSELFNKLFKKQEYFLSRN